MDAKDKFFEGWLITGDVARPAGRTSRHSERRRIDEQGAIIISDTAFH